MRSFIQLVSLISCCLFSNFLTGQNIPRANFSGPMGAQVNTYNGNLYLERTDVAIPNQDLPLGLSFAYNSFRDSTDRGYGYGWSHNYALRFQEIPAGVVIEREHGRRDTFTVIGEQFRAPTGIFDVLTKQGTAYQLRDKFGMVYDFTEPDHRYVTSITNTNSNSITLAYTDSLISQISDASGRSLQMTYDDGHLSSISDPNFPGGRTWTYNYTTGNQLTCVANPFGDCQTYAWDESGRMISYTDERGFELSISYEEDGRVRSLRTCISTVDFAFNRAQGRTVITEQNDGTDQITTHIYDREGKLVRKTGNCCGYDQLYEYNANNSISKTTDANGFARIGTYDDFGNTVATRDALQDQQQFTFGNLNRLTSFTDKRGHTTNFSYDGNGNLTRINQPENVSLEMGYDSEGNVTSMKNGRGNPTTMAYNGNNDLTRVQYPIGEETYAYDNAGNLERTVDANLNPTSFDYDALNRLETITDALGNTINYTYDPASNLATETDGNGNLKSYDYDAHNRLTAVTTPIGTTRYGYDALDNLTSITNAEGHTSTFAYDTRSRLIMEADAMGFMTRYDYDNNGNVVARYDANGQTTVYTYDAQNRLLSKTYSGNTDNYAYDANGNLVRASNDNITYEFTYDALNRLTSKYVVEWDKRISYEYDANGNRTKMIDPDGGETTYSYDLNDRLIGLLNPFGEFTQFSYDVGGRLTEQRNFNGTRATYTYDAANRLLKLSNLKSDDSVISSYEYTYDGNGLRTTMKEADGGINRYTYDGENRLTKVIYADDTIEDYVFDKAGNRTRLTTTSPDGAVEVINYTYDAADRIMTAGDTRYTFDGNGNMIRKIEGEEVTEFEWDGENRLVANLFGTEEKQKIAYGPLGRKVSTNSASNQFNYFSDEDHDVYVFSNNSLYKVKYTVGLIYDEWISKYQDEESTYYHKDGLGSITQTTDTNQILLSSLSYNVDGQEKESGITDMQIGFTGREQLGGAGSYYFRSRFYDSVINRFLNKDAHFSMIDRPSSLNKFAYVENSPLNYSDPTGEIIPLLGAIVFHTVRFVAVQTYKQIIKKGVAKLSTKSILANGSLNAVDQTVRNVANGRSLSCIDLFDVAVDGLTGYSPIRGVGQGSVKALSYVPKTHAKRQTIESQARSIKRIGQKKAAFKNEAEFSKIVNARAKGDRMYAAEEIGKDLVQAQVTGQLKDSNKLNTCSDSESTGSQADDDDSPMQGPVPPLPGLPDPPSDSSGRKPRYVCIPERGSVDPNEIIGPEGIPDLKWVKGDATLPYTILFENDPELATAPAQRVVLTHEFDESVNPFSLRIGSFGFGEFFFEVPEDLSYYDTRLDLRDSLGIYLNVIAGIDQEQNQAFWILESIDPATGFASTLPVDAGFLPVNDTLLGNGEGFVNFTILPSAAAQLGDRIEAQASIIFDDNEPILTNVELNTIDPERPVSRVSNIDTLAGGARYLLRWEAADQGSGLDDVTLFVSTNGSPFIANTEFTGNVRGEYTFTGHPDSVYRFFTLARDLVGNVERMKAAGEPACMTITVASLTNADAGQSNGATEIEVTGNTGTLSYRWEHDATLSGPSADNLAPGTYRVIVTDANGCVAEAIIEVDQLNAIIAPAAAPSILKIYPVPTRTEVTLEFFAPGNLLSATIHDLNGRVLLRQTIGAVPRQLNQTTFNISNLPAGQYYLRLTSPEGTSAAGRFLKQ